MRITKANFVIAILFIEKAESILGAGFILAEASKTAMSILRGFDQAKDGTESNDGTEENAVQEGDKTEEVLINSKDDFSSINKVQNDSLNITGDDDVQKEAGSELTKIEEVPSIIKEEESLVDSQQKVLKEFSEDDGITQTAENTRESKEVQKDETSSVDNEDKTSEFSQNSEDKKTDQINISLTDNLKQEEIKSILIEEPVSEDKAMNEELQTENVQITETSVLMAEDKPENDLNTNQKVLEDFNDFEDDLNLSEHDESMNNLLNSLQNLIKNSDEDEKADTSNVVQEDTQQNQSNSDNFARIQEFCDKTLKIAKFVQTNVDASPLGRLEVPFEQPIDFAAQVWQSDADMTSDIQDSVDNPNGRPDSGIAEKFLEQARIAGNAINNSRLGSIDVKTENQMEFIVHTWQSDSEIECEDFDLLNPDIINSVENKYGRDIKAFGNKVKFVCEDIQTKIDNSPIGQLEVPFEQPIDFAAQVWQSDVDMTSDITNAYKSSNERGIVDFSPVYETAKEVCKQTAELYEIVQNKIDNSPLGQLDVPFEQPIEFAANVWQLDADMTSTIQDSIYDEDENISNDPILETTEQLNEQSMGIKQRFINFFKSERSNSNKEYESDSYSSNDDDNSVESMDNQYDIHTSSEDDLLDHNFNTGNLFN